MTEDPRTARVVEALRSVLDPELGVSVVDLGLVYGIAIDGDRVRVSLTMTSPACPMAELVVRDAEEAVRRSVPEVPEVAVLLVWEPAWDPTRMSDAARRQLGWGA